MAAARSEETLRALLRARSAVLADVDCATGAPERLLVRSDLTGTMQLYELAGGRMRQLTECSEPVSGARYTPGERRVVVSADEGGNERHQLYLLDLEAHEDSLPVSDWAQLLPLTADPRHVHRLAGVSPDGRSIAYVSNRGNGVDFDLWRCELATNSHRCLYAPGAWLQPASGFSPDGRLISVLVPGDEPLDLELVLVDVASGEAHTVLAHPHQAALVGEPAWTGERTFYVSCNVDREFAAIARFGLEEGRVDWLPEVGERYDSAVVSSADGSTIMTIENRDGASSMRLHDAAGGSIAGEIELPEPGVVASHAFAPPILSRDGATAYFTLSTPRLPGDVFAYDAAGATIRRLTHSPTEIEAEHLVGVEHASVKSFDGLELPLLVYRPRSGEARPPAVVLVHGGPESQSVQAFHPIVQGLALAGYGVVVPNVRGSTGYGKRYAALDDTTRRLDSVHDLEAVHGYLQSAGFDSARAALWGGSYGGYMVLAGLAFQPQLWAAGVDIVGISNLVSFLERTSAYRRAHREREYGSLKHDREFLEAASPLTHAEQIRAPLMVIHGRNDPRVPVTEAEQLVEVLRRRGVPCELAIYEDEGHGLARLSNRLDAYPRAVAFLDRVL
ncbi:MAG: S9 family peptidase, partial [Solirubrobacteraceae bacterium]